MAEPVFKDLRVLELASVLAGPSVGQFFAELGASVIKIENAVTPASGNCLQKMRPLMFPLTFQRLTGASSLWHLT
jgi:crotonobetainyl-CoA:carnitine CoA-transferase CaiB-like acyl-CoA transferase